MSTIYPVAQRWGRFGKLDIDSLRAMHLTLPSLRDGPLPLPKAERGKPR